MSSEVAAYLSNALPDGTEIALPLPAVLGGVHPENGSSAEARAINTFSEQQPDEALLSLVGDGSTEALSILFRRHARSVFNVAYRILRDNSEAEDLRQEVFLYLFEKASLFNAKKGSAGSWIIQITYHRAIDRRRYLEFRQQYNVQQLNEERPAVPNGPPLIDEMAAKALLHQLRDQLSIEQHETLELHFLEGYSFREIAEKTGQTFGNVRNHYYRALERLRSSIFPHARNRSEKIRRS